MGPARSPPDPVTVSTQLQAACRPSSRRILLSFHRPTAGPQASQRATLRWPALFFSPAGPQVCAACSPSSRPPSSLLLRRGPQPFPVWAKDLFWAIPRKRITDTYGGPLQTITSTKAVTAVWQARYQGSWQNSLPLVAT